MRIVNFVVWSLIIMLFTSQCMMTKFHKKTARVEFQQGQRMAVLDFEKSGFMEGGGLAQFAADELSRLLFVNKQYPLVDRTIVRAKLSELNINPIIMSLDQIRALGKALDVDILVLGTLTQFGGQIIDVEENQNSEVQATVRLLAVRDGSNLAMITKRISMKKDARLTVSQLLEKIVGEMD